MSQVLEAVRTKETFNPKHEEFTPVVEALYTICPVFTAANVAVELGWFDEEFKRAGGRAVYLRSLPKNAGWIPHYTHGFDNLFRDGGAIPTIKAKADLKNTTLIGLTWGQRGGQIVVRSDSGIHRVADLKGRKIGLYHSLNLEKIDFVRATAHRGILLALDLAGIKASDVQITDLDDADTHSFHTAQKPSELWAQNRQSGLNFNKPSKDVDVTALAEGKVDAIYSSAARSENLIRSGKFKVIEDLSRHPDWTLQVANGPYTIAVNTEFAQKNRGIVVAYLRASIRAGRWINSHRSAAAPIFTRTTFNTHLELVEEHLQGLDLIPNLSEKNLAAIDIQKNFLREHGYVKNDFKVHDWADASYLNEAFASL